MYKFGGKGGGADKVSSCVSVQISGLDAEALLECVVRDKGAKTVRYGLACAGSRRAKGFVGKGDVSRVALGGTFEEKGSREEISCEKCGLDELAAGLVEDAASDVSDELLGSQ